MDKDKALQQLAHRIAQLRKANGYETAAAFARAHNLPVEQYKLYESGYDIDVASLLALMALLNVTPGIFFSEGFK